MEKNHEVNPQNVRLKSYYHKLAREFDDPMDALKELCVANCHYTIGRLLPLDPTYPRQKVESVGLPGCINYQMPGLCQPINDGGSTVRIFKMVSAKPLKGKEGAILTLVPVCEIPEQLLNNRAFCILVCGSDAFPMQRFSGDFPGYHHADLKLEETCKALKSLLYYYPNSGDQLNDFFELCYTAVDNVVNGEIPLQHVLDEFRFESCAEFLQKAFRDAYGSEKKTVAGSSTHAKAPQSTNHGRKKKEDLLKILNSYRANA